MVDSVNWYHKEFRFLKMGRNNWLEEVHRVNCWLNVQKKIMLEVGK